MRVLFVCSGNRGISPIVEAQADSLRIGQVSVEIATIIGKGFLGYLSNTIKLKKEIAKHKPDIVHAHYSFCGIVAALASSMPVVTSLMGSDVIHSGPWRWLILLFIRYFWAATIVKSEGMEKKLGSGKILVLPNGVDLNRFVPLDKAECRRKLGWSGTDKIVLFPADPARMEKNYELAHKAFHRLSRNDWDLKVVHGVSQSSLPIYYNASDVVLLTSRWEGSPNTVKEAMACNVRVVATTVGDIAHIFGDARGYYISDQTETDIRAKLSTALQDNEQPEGRQRIIKLQIDSKSVAKRLSDLYRSIIT